jgi:hypothetical protein
MVSQKIGENSKNNQNNKKSEQATIQYLVKTVETLQKENEALKREILKSKKPPSGKIGFLLIVFGALALAGSVVSSSTTLAFIGLGLTFWGALFFFARPVKFVRSVLPESTAIATYTMIDRILHHLNYKGKAIYIPPYPKEAYLPEYLKGLKEMILFIPAEETIAMPTIEEMATKQFLLKNPKGICITPPGYGLMSLFEEELRTSFTQIDLENFHSSLPTVIINNLELAKNLEINLENGLTHVKITDWIYKDLYSRKHNFKSIYHIGCPLASAIACALAKVTGKLVRIEKTVVHSELQEVEIWYQTIEA